MQINSITWSSLVFFELGSVQFRFTIWGSNRNIVRQQVSYKKTYRKCWVKREALAQEGVGGEERAKTWSFGVPPPFSKPAVERLGRIGVTTFNLYSGQIELEEEM